MDSAQASPEGASTERYPPLYQIRLRLHQGVWILKVSLEAMNKGNAMPLRSFIAATLTSLTVSLALLAMPTYADQDPEHNSVARGDINALDEKTYDLQQQSLNIQLTPGPQGPPGADSTFAGPQGDQGPQGPSGAIEAQFAFIGIRG